MQVKVSVIVPVYNSEWYIEQTSLRLANQMLKAVKIICVDDGSIDSS